MPFGHIELQLFHFHSCEPAKLDIDATVNEHVCTKVSEPGYEPIDHDVHCNEIDTEDLLDNLAYGKVDVQPESAEHQIHNNDFELKGNSCYTSVSSTPIPDEGVYSYPTTNFEPVQMSDYLYS